MAVLAVVAISLGIIVVVSLFLKEGGPTAAHAKIQPATQTAPVPPKVRPAQAGAGIYRSASYQPTAEDERFTQIWEDAFADRLQYGFYTSVAGVSHRNDDGTLRRRIIRQCEMGEQLQLEHEPSNPYDRNAVAVRRSNGEQLGYIPARTAQEIVRDAKRGLRWLCIFRRHLNSPENDKVAGCIVLLMCCSAEVVQDAVEA